ncbi:glycosyltransferase [Marinomonas sp. THO17]|uniref:glycosyltransferase n=1 Tax=Marinomonas sp. THO17 TaxID=3149048 RepID=UPI00336C16C1
MRTLVVVRTLKTGGMERVAVNLADAFSEQGHESHLMYFKKRSNPISPKNRNVIVHHYGINTISFFKPTTFFFTLVAKILNLFIRKSYFLFFGWHGGKLLQKKVSQLEKNHGKFDKIIFRGEGTYEIIWSFKHDKAVYVLENIVKSNTNNFFINTQRNKKLFHHKNLVAVSTGVKNSADTFFLENNITPKSLNVITNPCPVEQIRVLAEKERPKRAPTGSYIVNVARLVPQKNHHLLIQAYSKSSKKLPLVIVGAGKLESELKLLAIKLGVEENIYFVGNQSNPYVWMKHAELFVLSSSFEGLGIVLFEALTCGTPIISVDCPGGVRDILKGELEAYLCPADPIELANKIDHVLEKGGYSIKEEWLEDFKPENIVSAYLK